MAVDAAEIVVCVPDDRPECRQAFQDALDERTTSGIGRVRSQVLRSPAGYVSGEESALVNWLGGGDAKPSFRPDKALALTFRRRHALVHNAETLAHVALIARYGAGWFRSAGLPEAPGTFLVTLSGALQRAGVYEVEMGKPIGSILRRAGLSAQIGGLLVGGYGGTWIAPERIDTPYAPAPLAAVGGAIGPGIIAALPASSCGVAETARVTAYMAQESAGQCGPCVYGLPAIASDLALLARGEGDRHCLARLRQRLEIVEGRGACRHPDGVVRVVRSALEVFAADVADHARHRPCPGLSCRPVLRVRT